MINIINKTAVYHERMRTGIDVKPGTRDLLQKIGRMGIRDTEIKQKSQKN